LIEGEKLYKSWKMADESKKGEIKSWLIYTYRLESLDQKTQERHTAVGNIVSYQVN
jgi:hypothetical protein